MNSFGPGLITRTGFFRYQNPIFVKLFDVATNDIFHVAETVDGGGDCLVYMVVAPELERRGACITTTASHRERGRRAQVRRRGGVRGGEGRRGGEGAVEVQRTARGTRVHRVSGEPSPREYQARRRPPSSSRRGDESASCTAVERFLASLVSRHSAPHDARERGDASARAVVSISSSPVSFGRDALARGPRPRHGTRPRRRFPRGARSAIRRRAERGRRGGVRGDARPPDDAEDGPARAYGAGELSPSAPLSARTSTRTPAFTTAPRVGARSPPPTANPPSPSILTRACDDPTKRGAGTEALIFDAAARRVKRVEVTY